MKLQKVDHPYTQKKSNLLLNYLLSIVLLLLSFTLPLTGVALEESYHAKDPGYNDLLDALQIFGKESVGVEEWESVWKHRNILLDTLSQSNFELEAVRNTILLENKLENPPAILNPWGNVDQTVQYVPEVKTLSFVNNQPTKVPIPPSAISKIPNRYLMAEKMGIGKNSFYIELTPEDGQLFTSIIYGFSIEYKLRHSLIGRFYLKNTEIPIQTFRYSILSKSRVTIQEINLGPGVKPHQEGLNQRPLMSHKNLRHFQAPWTSDQLADQFPEKYRPENLSLLEKKNQIPIEQKVEHQILAQFRNIKKEIARAQWNRFLKKGYLEQLTKSQNTLIEWASNYIPKKEKRPGSTSKFLPDHSYFRKRIFAQIDDNQPFTIKDKDIQLISYKVDAILARGLIHRVPEEYQIQAFELLTNILDYAAWKN